MPNGSAPPLPRKADLFGTDGKADIALFGRQIERRAIGQDHPLAIALPGQEICRADEAGDKVVGGVGVDRARGRFCISKPKLMFCATVRCGNSAQL